MRIVNRGVSDIGFLLLILVVLFVAWILTGGPNRITNEGPFLTAKSKTTLSAGQEVINQGGTTYSPWRGQIKLERGTAASALQANDEYIVIKNTARSGNPITITGWRLKNAGDKKLYPTSVGYQYGQSAIVAIPTGTLLLLSTSQNLQQPINLASGEKAIITSGRIPNLHPIPVTSSFKVNRCSGYLDDLPGYKFTPTLANNCPDPESVSGVENLDNDCYRFIKRLSRCHTPEFDEVEGTGAVDGVTNLPPVCKNFIRQHYNYSACVVREIGQPNFWSKEWRVFLNTGSLWANTRETISLYDGEGRLVDQISY